MTLSEIHNQYKREIDYVKTPSFSRSRLLRQNLLMLSLVEQLSSYYESLDHKKIIGFEINRNQITPVAIQIQEDFLKGSYHADLFTIFIGPFSVENGKFVATTVNHVLAECSSSSFYATLSPFKVLHNYGFKKVG